MQEYRILFAGDTHGSPQQIAYLYNIACNRRVDYILQLGDFGYWEHQQGGPEFLDVCQWHAEQYEIPLYWIDGNHENFDWLYDYPLDRDGFRPVRPDVIHIPRGTRWEWGSASFLAFGGSYSIDRYRRILGISYWEQEMPTKHEAAQARRHGKVDVMVTHDVPDGADLSLLLGPDWKAKSEKPEGCREARTRVREVWEIAQPDWLFHGHYHVRADSRMGGTQIVGLANENTDDKSYVVYDTEKLSQPAF